MTVDEIIRVLNDIRAKNDLGNEKLKETMSEINTKIDSMSDDGIVDMLRFQISDLKNWFAEEQNTNVSKIDSLKRLFENVVQSNAKLAKTTEMKELFVNLNSDLDKLLTGAEKRESLLTGLNDKFASITDLNVLNKNEISAQIQEFSSNLIVLSNNIAGSFSNIFDVIEKLNISEKFDDLKSQLAQIENDLSNQIGLVTLNFPVEEIEQKFDEYKNIAENLRDEFHQSAEAGVENSIRFSESLENVSAKLSELQGKFENKSGNNPDELKSLLEDLISKTSELDDSISKVNTQDNFEVIDTKLESCLKLASLVKELVSEISINDELDIFKKSTENNFENIYNSVNDIKQSFENNSKLNYEGILNEIEDLKSKVEGLKSNTSSDGSSYSNVDIECINGTLNELSGNVEILRDISLKKHQEITESVSETLKDLTEDLLQKLNSNNELNTAEVRAVLNDLISEFDTIKSEFLKINDSTAFSVSAGFNNVNTIFENVFAGINSLGENFENISKQNSQNILDGINNINLEFEELKKEMCQSEYVDKITASINSVLEKFDEISEKDIYREDLEKIKDILLIIQADSGYSRELKESADIQSDMIREIAENAGAQSEKIIEIAENSVIQSDKIREIAENTGAQSEKMIEIAENSVIQSDKIREIAENTGAQSEKMIEIAENSVIQSDKIREIAENTGAQSEKISEIAENSVIQSDKIREIAENSVIQSDKIREIAENTGAQSEKMIEIAENSVIQSDKIREIAENTGVQSEKMIEIAENSVIQSDKIREIAENTNVQSEKIGEVAENIVDLKGYIGEINSDIHNYINELLSSSDNSKTTEQTSQKLLDLEASLIQISQGYDLKFEELQSKIAEFVHIVEGSNSDTEGKILSSLEKVTGIKDELTSIQEVLDNINCQNNEKFNETISLIDAGVENIVFNINSLDTSIKNGIEDLLKENIVSIEEKFVELSDNFNNLRNENSGLDDKQINDIVENITFMKDEFSRVNDDITEAIQCKTDDILKAFEPLKLALDTFVDTDIEKLLLSFKSDLEMSYLNFTADLNKEAEASREVFLDIQESIKEILSKVDFVEEFTNKSLQDNIETLRVSLESGLRGISSDFDEKLNELKLYYEVAKNDANNSDLNNELKEQLFKAVENLKLEQEIFVSKSDELFANVSVMSDTVRAESKNIIENLKNGQESIDSKTEELLTNLSELSYTVKSETENIIENFQNGQGAIDSKADELLTNVSELSDTVKSESKSIIENLKNEELKELIEGLRLYSTDIKESLDNVDVKVDRLVDANGLLSTIDTKFDDLAKFSVLDKYLQDVLSKLDSIDIDKKSEDIKETVLNAVLSLSDQGLLVEETEDIKDLIEDKTENIKQSLVQIQNELKQLLNGDNDFEYTYTLQDIESDIAKLRLAVNNLKDTGFEEVSDTIKKISETFENLEALFNQQQAQTPEIKADIDKINEDIVSISSRTNKLIINADESMRVINDGFNSSGELICQVLEKLNANNNTETIQRLEEKINNIETMSNDSANSDKTVHQALSYLGEWVDSTTQDILSISEHTSKMPQAQEALDEIQKFIPDNTQAVENLRKIIEDQETRIDNLESKLDRIISTLEEKDDMVLNRKVDKIEKLLSELGASVEKLTSYVDEE